MLIQFDNMILVLKVGFKNGLMDLTRQIVSRKMTKHYTLEAFISLFAHSYHFCFD